jgi:hypothetical protein
MLAYLHRGGQLPWMGIQAANKARRYYKARLLKEDTPFEELFKGSPDCFI